MSPPALAHKYEGQKSFKVELPVPDINTAEEDDVFGPDVYVS